MAGALDHAARNDMPVAAGGVCGERGTDRLGAAAVLSVLPVRAARQRARGARGCASRSLTGNSALEQETAVPPKCGKETRARSAPYLFEKSS